MSFKLGSRDSFIANRYDWSSWWNFEVIAQSIHQYRPVPGSSRSQHVVQYRIFRPQRELAVTGFDNDWREVPNFDWRRANDPKYAR